MLTLVLFRTNITVSLQRSILKSSGIRGLEILFVDSSKDGLLGEKANEILKVAQHDFIVFAFNDTIFQTKGWAKHVLRCFKQNQEATILGNHYGSRYIDRKANCLAINAETISAQRVEKKWHKQILAHFLKRDCEGIPVAIITGQLLLINRKNNLKGFSNNISYKGSLSADICLNNRHSSILVVPGPYKSNVEKPEIPNVSLLELQQLASLHKKRLPTLLDIKATDRKPKHNEPLVAVVIPIYNYGKQFHTTITSVLEQDYSNIEIIIVDDGSSDSYVKLKLASLSKIENITVFSQKNRGPSAARNKGIEHSSGKYILPLDSDDRIKPGYVTACVNILEKDKNISPVYCDTIHVGEMENIEIRPEWSKKLLISGPYIVNCSMFSREAFNKAGGYDEQLTGWEDYDLWLRMMKIGFVGKRINKPLFVYFHHESDGTVSTEANKDIAQLHRKILKKNHLTR